MQCALGVPQPALKTDRMGPEPLRNSKIAGDKPSWTIEAGKPTSVKLNFEITTIQSGTMSGYASSACSARPT
jgi:hypothetical protein